MGIWNCVAKCLKLMLNSIKSIMNIAMLLSLLILYNLLMMISVLNESSTVLIKMIQKLLCVTYLTWTIQRIFVQEQKHSVSADRLRLLQQLLFLHQFSQVLWQINYEPEKLSKCEVKARLCWNLNIWPPLRFYVKSNLPNFKV